MKLQLAECLELADGSNVLMPDELVVHCESDPLADVILCPPTYLAPVPCCSKTRQSIRAGFELSTDVALREHGALQAALVRHGVTCHLVEAVQGMQDLCFTRDVAVTTPWGVVMLNPAKSHRAPEVDHVASALQRFGARIMDRVKGGTIEGGDICIARPGLLILAVSGERTSEGGARSFAAPFRKAGWDVIEYQLDPHFLHLDTVFCMLDRQTAVACVDVLEEPFLRSMAERGIRLIPTTYEEARDLGGNVVSLDGKAILMSAGQPRVASALRRSGFEPIEVPISQFAACGGGLHCLTLPLARRQRGERG